MTLPKPFNKQTTMKLFAFQSKALTAFIFHSVSEFSNFSGVGSGQVSMTLNSKKWRSAKGYILIKKGDRRKLVLGEDYAKYKSKNNARAKGQNRFHVYCLNSGKYLSSWDTQEACSIELKISRRSIGICLDGKRSYSKNYIFKYKKVANLTEYGKNLKGKIKRKAIVSTSATLRGNDSAICIYCANTGRKLGEYKVIKDISRDYGVVDSTISAILKKKDGYWQANGFTFGWKGEGKPLYGEALKDEIAWRRAKK